MFVLRKQNIFDDVFILILVEVTSGIRGNSFLSEEFWMSYSLFSYKSLKSENLRSKK